MSVHAPAEQAAELARSWAQTQARVCAAARSAGRQPDTVTVIAVTKTFPSSDVALLADLGATDVGESVVAHAAAKRVACADLDLVWHLVGQVQTNKARAACEVADVIHSVDRLKLVAALAAAVDKTGRSPVLLLQVALDDAPGRGGAIPAEVPALADAVVSAGLNLGGLMAVAPLGADPDAAFARLAATAERLRGEHPAATMLSAGMSGDLEAAVRHGATHVRVGRAILGSRPPAR